MNEVLRAEMAQCFPNLLSLSVNNGTLRPRLDVDSMFVDISRSCVHRKKFSHNGVEEQLMAYKRTLSVR